METGSVLIMILLVCLVALAIRVHGQARVAVRDNHVAYLDGLRGVCAFMVVVFHFLLEWYPAVVSGRLQAAHHAGETLLPFTPLYGLYSGSLAVAIFFVMSGFVLSYPFFSTQKREVPVSGACRRYVRLALPVCLTSFLYYLCLKCQWIDPQTMRQLGQVTLGTSSELYAFQPGLLDVLNHSLVRVFWNGEFKYNPVLWTMKTELFGSLLVFSLCFLFGRLPWRWAIYLLFLPLIIRAEYLAFVIGMALCDWKLHGSWQLGKASRLALLLIGAYLAAYPHFLDPALLKHSVYAWTEWVPGLNFRQRSWAILVCGATCLLTVLLGSKRLQAFFSDGISKYLGQVSFSLYLTHFAVLFSVTPALFLTLNTWLPGYHLAAWGSFGLTLPVIFAIATLTYHWVEQPSVRFSTHLYKAGLKPAALWLYAKTGWSPLSRSEPAASRLQNNEDIHGAAEDVSRAPVNQ